MALNNVQSNQSLASNAFQQGQQLINTQQKTNNSQLYSGQNFQNSNNTKYYNNHNPFAPKQQKTGQSNIFYDQSQNYQDKKVDPSKGSQQKDFFYNQHIKDMKLNNPHLRNISLPQLKRYYVKEDVNLCNSRHNMPGLSPHIQSAKAKPNYQYNPQTGFILRIDGASNLPKEVERGAVEFSVQDTEGVIFQTDKTRQYPSEIKEDKIRINERKELKGMEALPQNFLYVEFQGKPINSKFYYEVTSAQRIFDETGKLITGKFKAPLYDVEQDPQELINAQIKGQMRKKYKPVVKSYLHYRICYPGDPELDNDQKFKQNEYLVPGEKPKPKDNTKFKMEPLKHKYDMDKLNKHMQEMQNISMLAGRQLKLDAQIKKADKGDQSIPQRPEWLQSELSKQKPYEPFSYKQEENHSQQQQYIPNKYNTNNYQPKYLNGNNTQASNPQGGNQQPFVYVPYGIPKQDMRTDVIDPRHPEKNNLAANQINPSNQSQQPSVSQQQQQSPVKPQQYRQQVALPQQVQQQAALQLDKSHKFGGIKVKCLRMEQFAEDCSLAFDITIQGPKGALADRTGEVCQAEADQVFDGDPSDNICHMDQEFDLAVNPYSIVKEHPDVYQQYHMVFNFMGEQEDNDDEIEVGWLAFPIFDKSGNFKQGLFSQQIFQTPAQETIPYNYSKIKKLKELFVFELKYIIMDK